MKPTFKDQVISILWNKFHKAPNPIGLFLISWVISVIIGIIGGPTEENIKNSMVSGIIGTILCMASFAYIEIKKAINKKKDAK